MYHLCGEQYGNNATKKQYLPTKFLKSETIYKRRVSTTTQREWPIPSIAVKVSVVQDDIFGVQ